MSKGRKSGIQVSHAPIGEFDSTMWLDMCQVQTPGSEHAPENKVVIYGESWCYLEPDLLDTTGALVD
jgi:hypothetical protein